MALNIEINTQLLQWDSILRFVHHSWTRHHNNIATCSVQDLCRKIKWLQTFKCGKWAT